MILTSTLFLRQFRFWLQALQVKWTQVWHLKTWVWVWTHHSNLASLCALETMTVSWSFSFFLCNLRLKADLCWESSLWSLPSNLTSVFFMHKIKVMLPTIGIELSTVFGSQYLLNNESILLLFSHPREMGPMQLWSLPGQEARVHMEVLDWKNKHNWGEGGCWRDSYLEITNFSSIGELGNKLSCSAVLQVITEGSSFGARKDFTLQLLGI